MVAEVAADMKILGDGAAARRQRVTVELPGEGCFEVKLPECAVEVYSKAVTK